MLKGSLEGQIGADNKDLKDNNLGAATEDKASSEGDLSGTTKELAEAKPDLATASANCTTTAADHEATVAARKEDAGADDQGVMFGYASDEVEDCMPSTHSVAPSLARP